MPNPTNKPTNQKTTQKIYPERSRMGQNLKTKTTLDEQIKVAHEVLWALCAFLIFVAIGSQFVIPKARMPVVPPAPERERITEHLNYPKIGHVFLRDQGWEIAEIDFFSGWDFRVWGWTMGNTDGERDGMDAIKDNNPNIIFLHYVYSAGLNANPNAGTPLFDSAIDNDWWLYKYDAYPNHYCDPGEDPRLPENECGNYIADDGSWGNYLLNMTDLPQASDNPELKPNEAVPLDAFVYWFDTDYQDIWDGIFYDVFANQLSWFSPNIKDADEDGLPEPDNSNCGDCDSTWFRNYWEPGMVTLLQNTANLAENWEDFIIVENGPNTDSDVHPFLNGGLREQFRPIDRDLSFLAETYQRISRDQRQPAIQIMNGVPDGRHDQVNCQDQKAVDPTDYQAMRFTLGSALLLGMYYGFDYGDCYHSEALWYDEFSVNKDNGEVAAITTELRADINSTQTTIPVDSTEGFEESGVITITGEGEENELVLYRSKTATTFEQVTRGYPDPSSHDEASHKSGATVIYYLQDYRGYLGQPDNTIATGAYDANNPNTLLSTFFEPCMWDCDDNGNLNSDGAEAKAINSRVWRRDFENGIVLLNASNDIHGYQTLTVKLEDGLYRKIKGLQDPAYNSGEVISAGNGYTCSQGLCDFEILPEDAYILLKTETQGTLDITLSGDSSVPQGGILRLTTKVVNNSSDYQTFDLWYDLDQENWPNPRENPLSPQDNIRLDPYGTREWTDTLEINDNTQPLTYTFLAYLGPNLKERDTYDYSDTHDVLVTEVPGQYNPQEATPLEFEITGSTTKLWREAERSILTPPMKRAEDPEASDGAYILVPNGEGEDGRAQYTITIPEADDYIIWGRVLAPSGEDDSFWVKMDEGEKSLWDLPYQITTWNWDKVSHRGGADPVIFNLTQGSHTLTIEQREDGAKLDKLLVTNDMDYVPSGMGG